MNATAPVPTDAAAAVTPATIAQPPNAAGTPAGQGQAQGGADTFAAVLLGLAGGGGAAPSPPTGQARLTAEGAAPPGSGLGRHRPRSDVAETTAADASAAFLQPPATGLAILLAGAAAPAPPLAFPLAPTADPVPTPGPGANAVLASSAAAVPTGASSSDGAAVSATTSQPPSSHPAEPALAAAPVTPSAPTGAESSLPSKTDRKAEAAPPRASLAPPPISPAVAMPAVPDGDAAKIRSRSPGPLEGAPTDTSTPANDARVSGPASDTKSRPPAPAGSAAAVGVAPGRPTPEKAGSDGREPGGHPGRTTATFAHAFASSSDTAAGEGAAQASGGPADPAAPAAAPPIAPVQIPLPTAPRAVPPQPGLRDVATGGTPDDLPSGPTAADAPRLSVTTTRTGAALAIRLDVDTLGTIEVKFAKEADGATSISVASDREDTLRAIATDRTGMQAILQDAGIEPGHRHIEYGFLEPASGGGSSGSMTSTGSTPGEQGDNAGHPPPGDRDDSHGRPDRSAGADRTDAPTMPRRPVVGRSRISRTSVDINA